VDNISNKRNIIDFRHLKIVYWGPGESGKTTNFLRLKGKYKDSVLNSGIQIKTTDDRTLWEDSVSINLINKYNEYCTYYIINIVTCTGQERFLTTREYVLQGADGIIFVADSDPKKLEENKRSFKELLSFIARRPLPYLIELNKRDLPNAISIKRFKMELNLPLEEYDMDGNRVVYPCSLLDPNDEIYNEIFQDLILKILVSEYANLINN